VQRPLAAALAALTALALLGACGSDDSVDAGSDVPAEEPVPERIVSMSATATEVLFAIGAGDQVVAADDQSNFPEDAPTSDLSALEPNVEAIAAHDPDLVVVSDEDLSAGLEALDIDVYVAPAAEELADVYEQITDLGQATGHEDEAADLVAEMQDDIADLQAEVPDRPEPLTYYHELDSTLYSATSSTFIGALYELAGLESIADAADVGGESGGYPQLAAEYLVDADPDLVFLADTKCCQQTRETFAARPGFADLSAVTNDRVVLLDDDVASRWGPRIVDLLRQIVETVKAVPVG
jgi:iron complex transport system substrate-binding protein